MTRPTNAFRVLKLLYETKGTLSHQYIYRKLNLSKTSYQRVYHELYAQELVSSAGDGKRGLAITANGEREFENRYRGKGSVDKEGDLYEPLCELLREMYSEDEILNVGSLKRRGAWKNPDVLRVIIRRGALGFGTLFRLISYEVKRWDFAWELPNVFETAAHASFCHESYLVLEWARNITFSHEYLEAYGSHIIEACRRFGVGLFVIHPVNKEYRLERVLLASDAHPSEIATHEYLDYILQRRRYREAAERLRERANMIEREEIEDEDEN